MKPHLPNSLRSALLRCVTTVALIATCSSYAFADTEPLTPTFSEAEAPIILLSEDDLPVNETGNSAFLTAAALPSASDSLILAGTTTYTNGTYTRSNETEHLTGSPDFQSYESILFDENEITSSSSAAYGGAIDADESSTTLTFTDNGDITFSENSATCTFNAALGGAIFAAGGQRSFNNNSSITFSENAVSSTSNFAVGGAIAVASGTLTFSANGDISFCGNTASKKDSYSSSVVHGGAIYVTSSTLTFCDNGGITFSGNTASATGTSSSAYGGAICANPSSLTIQGAALFEKNTEIDSYTYRLRSIYQSGGSLELSAPTDKSIEFRDSIYSKATTVSLNKDYAKSDGGMQTADGTIRFTGATTEADLKAMKGGTEGTEEEITNSRTSELTGAVTLYGGNLVIEEKAILNISGSLTVEGGNITVATGAQLNLAKADITMPSLTLGGGTMMLGSEDDHDATLTLTTLTVTADSVLNANLEMTSGTITFAKDASITLGCSVTLGDGVVLNISDEAQESAAAGNLVTLMTSVESLTCGGKTYIASELNENVKIQGVFSNYQSADHCLVYTQSGDLMVTPEPATATLSLLTLAGLAVRRRRH